MLLHAALRASFVGQILILLGVSAYYQASGLTQLVSAAFAAHDFELPSHDAGRAKVARSREAHSDHGVDDHATSAQWILNRNPFDSETPRPLDAPAAVGSKGARDVNAAICQGVKAVVVVAARDPEWSMAALTVGDSHPRLVHVGDDIGGGRKVELVEWNRVVLSLGSQLCETNMFRPNQPDAAYTGSGKASHAEAISGTTPVAADIASKIQKIGTNEFRVDRDAVDNILKNHLELMKTVRIVPEQQNGRVVGIRLFGIGPDSPLGMLGIENGDRMDSINEFDLSMPETALEAYAKLRAADHLVVDISRRGQNRSIEFDIR